MNNIVFLTRGEIHIHDANNLSIHLRPNDKRLIDVSTLMSRKKLKIVTINPKLDKFYRFYKDNWYLIPNVEYTGSTDHSGYTHFSFKYKFDNGGYLWEREGVRLLKTHEIKSVRNSLSI
jgi:hypothetical protein